MVVCSGQLVDRGGLPDTGMTCSVYFYLRAGEGLYPSYIYSVLGLPVQYVYPLLLTSILPGIIPVLAENTAPTGTPLGEVGLQTRNTCYNGLIGYVCYSTRLLLLNRVEISVDIGCQYTGKAEWVSQDSVCGHEGDQ